jgi:hypothetical protein
VPPQDAPEPTILDKWMAAGKGIAAQFRLGLKGRMVSSLMLWDAGLLRPEEVDVDWRYFSHDDQSLFLDLPEAEFRRLLPRLSDEDAKRLCGHGRAPADRLRIIVEVRSGDVRAAARKRIAQPPSTPLEALLRLRSHGGKMWEILDQHPNLWNDPEAKAHVVRLFTKDVSPENVGNIHGGSVVKVTLAELAQVPAERSQWAAAAAYVMTHWPERASLAVKPFLEWLDAQVQHYPDGPWEAIGSAFPASVFGRLRRNLIGHGDLKHNNGALLQAQLKVLLAQEHSANLLSHAADYAHVPASIFGDETWDDAAIVSCLQRVASARRKTC